MKQKVEVFDVAKEICEGIQHGALLTTKAGDQINTMSIGWGTLGIEWNLPIFIAYVRKGRHTTNLLNENGEFTINIDPSCMHKDIVRFCGTHRGSDVNKIKECDMHLEQPVSISVPGIQEFPLTLECKVIYTQEQDLNQILQGPLSKFYPQGTSSLEYGSNQDVHIAYYGQILNAYYIREDN